MTQKGMLADRIAGAIAVAVGLIALVEAERLYPLRMRALVGDDTMLWLLGAVMVVLGLLMVFIVKIPPYKVEFPEKKVRLTILVTVGLLFVYCYMISLVGYLISTFLISLGLFKVIGSYRWRVALFSSIVLIAALYGVFILWLNMPFPVGVFGI